VSGWRTLVEVEANDLADEVRRAGGHDAVERTIALEALERARTAAGATGSLRELLLDWWSGSRIESAWGALHEAQGALMLLADADWVRAQVPRIERALQEALDPSDVRLERYRERLRVLSDPATPIRAAEREELRAMRRAASVASDQSHRDIRGLRNLLVATSVLLTAFLLVVGIGHALEPHFVPLCSSEGSLRGASATDLCVNGYPKPDRGDVFKVELIGAMAGLLGGLLALVKMTRLPEPYSLPTAQILLKAPAGATTALVGVLLLQSGALVGFSPQPGSQMLAYSALFGFSQQLLTSLVDRKAASLLGG